MRRVPRGLLAAALLCAGVLAVCAGCAKSFDGVYRLLLETGEAYEGFCVEIDGEAFRILTDGTVSAKGRCAYDGGEVTLYAETDGPDGETSEVALYTGRLDGDTLTLDPVTDMEPDGSGRLTLTSDFSRTGDSTGRYEEEQRSPVS